MSSESSLVPQVSTTEFPSRVIGAVLPVVVDFWAPWCGPCRQLSPVLEIVAQEYSDRLVVAKVNVDQEGALATAFGITSIPALIFYKAGSPREMITGMRSVADLRQWIDGHLAS